MSSLAPPVEEGARGGARLAPSVLCGGVVPWPLIPCGVGLSVFVAREANEAEGAGFIYTEDEAEGDLRDFLTIICFC